MKNRYGQEYWFEEVEPKTFRFHMDENVGGFGMRMGGREGQEKIDMNDLGMFDPSGGPYVSVDGEVWLDNDTKAKVTRIMIMEEDIFVEVE